MLRPNRPESRASEGVYVLQTLLGVVVLGYSGQLVEIEAVALAS
jgi:hypothetical protein